jgi:ATP-dependent DNA helicase DinG
MRSRTGQNPAELLGADGPLAEQLPDFQPREAQQAMAQAVATAFAKAQTLVVEAGTGTGKTYAYLVPALLSGQRVIVSTGTKTLQDQLYFRDLPRVRDALRVPVRIALLKGRANYLCRYRLRAAGTDPRMFAVAERLHAIDRWAATSERGELSELGELRDEARLVPRITSTADNCLGSRCPDFNDCFVVRARRAAQAADITIVNHHLLLADFSLKRQGFGEILPGADAVIVDEAHQLPELAAQFFGTRVSTGQVAELVRDVREEGRVLEDPARLSHAIDAVAHASVALEEAAARLPSRVTTTAAREQPGFASAGAALAEAIAALDDTLKPSAARSPGLEACAERAAALSADLQRVLVDQDVRDVSEGGDVRWVEPLARGVALHATPIHVADGFRALMSRAPAAWVFTSATLDGGDDFDSFREQLGLSDARTHKLDSPFDYPSQARLYLPPELPDPNHTGYSDAVADALLPLIETSGGGAFVLCTSHRAVSRIATRLQALHLPLMVQGEDSKARLLERFTKAGNAVLVGTASFWEGVDVRGHALRMVAIDRLPFAAPGDPVQEARLAAIRARGGNPFNDDQLPHAITVLRQGVGRLIRDANDRGLVVLCDPRLVSRSYGRRVLEALPPMPLVDRDEALRWLGKLRVAA